MHATRRTVVKTPLLVAGSLVVAVAGWRSRGAVSALGTRLAATPPASPIASPIASPPATPGSGGTDTTIRIVDFGFEPSSLEVPVGATVTWVNDGQAIHNTVAEDDTWASEILESGGSFSVTVTAAGAYPYLCTIHPMMKAELTVVE